MTDLRAWIFRGHRRRVAIAFFAFVGCGREVAEEPELRPVRTTTVVAGSGARERTFSGVTVAGVESVLSFRVAGTLIRLPVSVGALVEEGDEIAALDPADYRLRVREAEATLAQALAAMRNAQASYDRTRDLYENGTASKSQLDAARATAESANASVQAGESRLALARSQLGYTILRAPLDGAIAAVPAEVNENVGSGTPIAVLTAGESLEVEVGIPQALIAYLRPGASALVRLDALPERNIPATVTEVGAAATGQGATFPVRVRLDEDIEQGRPGMAAVVRLSFPSTEDIVVRLPAVAVGEDGDGRFVWVVEPAGDGRASVHRRSVSVGSLTGDGIEIVDGVEDGERVVVAGVSRIREGQTVLVDDPSRS